MDPTPEDLPEGIARALDELAAEDAADVLAAARSGARAQAQAVLERALVNRLLVRACAGERPEQPQQRAHSRRLDDGRLRIAVKAFRQAGRNRGMGPIFESGPVSIVWARPGAAESEWCSRRSRGRRGSARGSSRGVLQDKRVWE